MANRRQCGLLRFFENLSSGVYASLEIKCGRTANFVERISLVFLIVWIIRGLFAVFFKTSCRINYVGGPTFDIVEDTPNVNPNNTISN